MSNPTTHGLASAIRAATESETFDLGGLGPETIQNVIEDAMTDPFELSEMIRITLVVGAGKQSRQKYNAGAMKAVTSTLQNQCGFTEDRGASGVLECQGMYKVQHDTGKNLKTVVVFPKIAAASQSNKEDSATNSKLDSEGDSGASILPKSSMEYKVAASTLSVFQNMVKAKCASWSQKRALLQLIEQEIVDKIISPVDDLLMRGQRVPEDLQSVYDNSVLEISQKQQYLKDAMHNQVDAGNLTSPELDYLLEQAQHKLETTTSTNNKNPKAAAKLKERISKLKSIDPIPPPKLKHHGELGKLWKQVNSIQLPDATGGRLLTVQESKLVTKHDELMEEIDRLEQASRGWLEDDEVFEMRLKQCRSELDKKYSNKNNKSNSNKKGGNKEASIGASTKTRVPITKWVTPGVTSGQGMSSKKKNKMKKGDLFGAMMAASSSEEEDDEEETHNSEEEEEKEDDKNVSASTSQKGISAGTTTKNDDEQQSSKKKRNKKKKKGKGIKTNANSVTGGEEETETTTAVQASSSTSESISVPMAILSIILSILTWIVSSIFGGGGKNKKKKKKTR
eukprot:scaffold1284_cov108-Cylindrotheca_fusiformis.AAC.6